MTTSMNGSDDSEWNERVYFMQESACNADPGPKQSDGKARKAPYMDCTPSRFRGGKETGGAGQNRTADKGFADLRLATWLPRHRLWNQFFRELPSSRSTGLSPNCPR